MATTATSSVPPPLAEPHGDQAAGHESEVVLHELVALSLVGKQLLGAVYGPLFGSVHPHVDELVDSWSAVADQVAERAAALGVTPDRHPADHGMVRDLPHRVAGVAERARARSYLVGGTDAVSVDVVGELVRELERQQRMFRARHGDGA